MNGPNRIRRNQSSTSSSSPLIDCIAHLESLIASLTGNGNTSSASSLPLGESTILDEQETADKAVPVKVESQQRSSISSSDSFGHISFRDSKTTFVEDTHWTAILDGLSYFSHMAHPSKMEE